MSNAAIEFDDRSRAHDCRLLPVRPVERIRVVPTDVAALRKAS